MEEKKNSDVKKLEWSKPELLDLGKAKHITLGGTICIGGYGNISGCQAGTSGSQP
jgi:hypothetical protein